MTAVVAPICIENAKFGFIRVASFGLEVVHHLAKVVSIHCQPHLLAIRCKFLFREGGQTFEDLYRDDFRLLHCDESGKILLTGLDCIDIIFLDLGDNFICSVRRKDDEFGTLDTHLRRRIDETDTVHSRSRALVELPRKVLHGNIFRAFEVALVGNAVGHDLSEHAVAALLEKVLRETEEVIYIEQTQRREIKLKVFVQLAQEAACFHLKFRVFFYVNAIVVHIC